MLLLRCWLLAIAMVVVAAPARADEIAPELETLELRRKARAELRDLTTGLPEEERRRLVGLYLAFDPSPSDAIAMAACDDDGDFIIVLSDAMLRLLEGVASAASLDEANGSRRLEDYAELLARSQVAGRRLLPPPAGFYSATRAGATRDDRLREAVAFVVARELAHLRAGDLACAHPTATREHGDDEWTAAETRAARDTAKALYPGRARERDAEAIARVRRIGRGDAGAIALLRFSARLEAERARALATWPMSWLALHPRSEQRLDAVGGQAAR